MTPQEMESQLMVMGFIEREQKGALYTKWSKGKLFVYRFNTMANSLYEYELFHRISKLWTPKFETDSRTELMFLVKELDSEYNS